MCVAESGTCTEDSKKHLAVSELTLPFRTVSLRDWASVQTLMAFLKILRPFVVHGSQSQLSPSDKKPSPVVFRPTHLSTLKTLTGFLFLSSY